MDHLLTLQFIIKVGYSSPPTCNPNYASGQTDYGIIRRGHSAGRPTFRQRAARNGGGRANAGIARRRVDRYQHGLPGAQGLPGRRRVGHDARDGPHFRARPRHGRSRAHPGDLQDAPGLGRR